MSVSKVDIGPLRALRFGEHQPIGIRFARAGAICQIPTESATSHVGRVMKSISHFCASTRGRRLMTLIS